MKAFITVIGHDTVGVVAKVAGLCTKLNINIEDVTQSILQGMFAELLSGAVIIHAVAQEDDGFPAGRVLQACYRVVKRIVECGVTPGDCAVDRLMRLLPVAGAVQDLYFAGEADNGESIRRIE